MYVLTFSAVRCTKPQHFKVIGSGRRNLTVSWEPAPYMGGQSPLLCYKILYASAQGKANEVNLSSVEGKQLVISNNWTEWSTIQGVIHASNFKSAKCVPQEQFEITSMIFHKVQ